MIVLNNVTKSYGKRALFEQISLHINRGEKIGLVGPNGSGKSTFFKLLLGHLEPSSGTIQVPKDTRFGYLPQESSFSSHRRVLQELIEGEESILRLKEEKEKLEEGGQAGSVRYGEVLHEMEAMGYFQLEHKAKKILMGLGFKESDFDRPLSEMSGGWQMRTLLAKLLTHHYDILLLDEPTNYLDLNAALWLKDYLAGLKTTFIMVSHDKTFLTEVTNYTFVLENGAMAKVRGDYEHYESIRDERMTHLKKQFDEQQKKRKQLEDFIARFHAQPNKAAAVRNKRKTLERMPVITLPPKIRQNIRKFRFPQTRPSGQRVIRLQEISKSYGDICVYRGLDFEVVKGEKAVLVGANGAGKSTLLKILAGVIEADSGVRHVGHNVDIGYFSQTRLDILNPDYTVLEEAYAASAHSVAQETIRTILGAFLFTGDDADKRISVLSGGEKSRLNLAKFLIRPPNFLLLDEPTTHLDVDAVDALVRALDSYEGTIVFISHDIHFVKSLANTVYEVEEGSVRKFHGGFDYYLQKRTQPQVFVPGRKKAQKSEEKRRIFSEREKAKEAEKEKKVKERLRKTHNKTIGAEIQKLEKEKQELALEGYAKTRALSDQQIWRDEGRVRDYGRRLKEIEKRKSEIDEAIKGFQEKLV